MQGKFAVPPTPPPESSSSLSSSSAPKNRFRAGLDWFQSQLNADGILNLGLGHSRRNNNHKSRRGPAAAAALPSSTASTDASTGTNAASSNHRIRFVDAEKNEVRATISLSEYSAEELAGSFFQREDLTRIFERANKIVIQMENGDEEVARLCTRGLDKLYGERQDACRTLRSKAINAVMDLQEDQWESGQDDFDQMAKASRDITNEAAVRAFNEARQDVRAARQYLQDVDVDFDVHVHVQASPRSSCSSSSPRNRRSPPRSKSILKTRRSDLVPPPAFLFPEKRNHATTDRIRERRGAAAGAGAGAGAARSTQERRMPPARTKSMPTGPQPDDGSKRCRSTPPVQRTRSNHHSQHTHAPGGRPPPNTPPPLPSPVTPATTTSRPSIHNMMRGGGATGNGNGNGNNKDSSMPTLTPLQRAKARVAHPPSSEASEHRRNKVAVTAALTAASAAPAAPSTITTGVGSKNNNNNCSTSTTKRNMAGAGAGPNRQLPRRCKSAHNPSSSTSREPVIPADSTHSEASFANDHNDDDSNSNSNSDPGRLMETAKVSLDHPPRTPSSRSNRQMSTRRKYTATLTTSTSTSTSTTTDGNSSSATTPATPGRDSSRHRRTLPQRSSSAITGSSNSSRGERNDDNSSSLHRRTTTASQPDDETPRTPGTMNRPKNRGRNPPQRAQSAAIPSSSSSSSSSSSGRTSSKATTDSTSQHRRTLPPNADDDETPGTPGTLNRSKNRRGRTPPQRSQSASAPSSSSSSSTPSVGKPKVATENLRRREALSSGAPVGTLPTIHSSGSGEAPRSMTNRPKNRGRTSPQRSQSAALPSSSSSSLTTTPNTMKTAASTDDNSSSRHRRREVSTGAPVGVLPTTNSNSPKMGRPARQNRPEASPQDTEMSAGAESDLNTAPASNASSTDTGSSPTAGATAMRNKRPDGGGESNNKPPSRAPPQRSKSSTMGSATPAVTQQLRGRRPPPPSKNTSLSPVKVRPANSDDPNEKRRQAPDRTKSLPATTPWAQREIKASLVIE